MWNGSSGPTVLNWKVRPSLNTANLFEAVSGLSNDGETNDQGVRRIMQLVLLADKFSNVFRATKPTYSEGLIPDTYSTLGLSGVV